MGVEIVREIERARAAKDNVAGETKMFSFAQGDRRDRAIESNSVCVYPWDMMCVIILGLSD